jgi:hypothetical protein
MNSTSMNSVYVCIEEKLQILLQRSKLLEKTLKNNKCAVNWLCENLIIVMKYLRNTILSPCLLHHYNLQVENINNMRSMSLSKIR